MKKNITALFLSFLLLLINQKNVIADPFIFTFENTIISTPIGLNTIPNVSTGDILKLSVIVDNGNDNLIEQTWQITDVISATVNVGSYSATYLPLFDSSYIGCCSFFNTNKDGLIDYAHFYDTDGKTNFDNFGSGGIIATNAIIDSTNNRYAFWNDSLFNPTLWKNQNGQGVKPEDNNQNGIPIPTPSIISLFGIGILILRVIKK